MKICSFKGCGKSENLSEVVITFKDAIDAPESHRCEGVIQDLLVCPDHAHPQPAEFVTDDGWNKIVAGMLSSGFAAPARETVKIKFRPTSRALDGDYCACKEDDLEFQEAGVWLCDTCHRPRQ